jgi:hypothetical protein
MLDGISFDVTALSGKGKCGGSQGILKPLAGERGTILYLVCRHSLTLIMDITRDPYTGPSRKLVVALDIGTTFSGAAYALLDPGEPPQIQPVTR